MAPRIGHTWTYVLEAVDPDSGPLTIRLDTQIAGRTLQGDVVTWQPDAGDEGEHPLTLTVRDDRDGSTSQTITHLIKKGVPPFAVGSPQPLKPAARACRMIAADLHGVSCDIR